MDQDRVNIVGIMDRALVIMQDREQVRNGIWKEGGFTECLLHAKSKLRRIAKISDDGASAKDLSKRSRYELIDDALDLINYTAFMIDNLEHGRYGTDI